jgi:hypothetical protein
VLTFQKCHSANDVLREIETRGLLSGDFLLVYNCATFCSSNLTTQIKNFRLFLALFQSLYGYISKFTRILKRQNKNSVATLLFTEQSDAEMQNSGPLVAFESSSKKIVHFDPHSHRRGKVRMPKVFHAIFLFNKFTIYSPDSLSCRNKLPLRFGPLRADAVHRRIPLPFRGQLRLPFPGCHPPGHSQQRRVPGSAIPFGYCG